MALDLTRLNLLEDKLAQVLPDGVAVACTDPRREAPEEDVFAAEAEAVARAVPKRRREFFAGRRAAHRAMAALGHLPSAVTKAPDRAPVWPGGLIGSISHCDRACAAVVARAADIGAVAVDLEPDTALPEGLEAGICLPQERDWLDSLPADARGRAARLIFSAKECAYKLQYPATKRMLDFSEVQVRIDSEAARFTAQFRPELPGFGAGFTASGHFGVEAGVMFCLMVSP